MKPLSLRTLNPGLLRGWPHPSEPDPWAVFIALCALGVVLGGAIMWGLS